MGETLISIIVPVYNVSAYIEDCIRSICQQTFRNFELILVDDCSTDDSIAKAEKVLTSYPIFYSVLRHEYNRGLSAARNTGMSVAKGEYVLFIDSDDYLSPDCLEKLYAKAKETGADVTYGGYYRVYDNPNDDKEISAQSVPSVGNYVMAWNKLCRRSFLQENQISFIEGLIHEDNPWSFELSVTKAKFASVSDITYHYRIRENSLQTHTDYQRHFNAYCRILQAYSDIIRRRNATDMLWYLEQQKAVYFSMTQEKGTTEQLHALYSLIRSITPKPSFHKPDAHYFMPEFFGFYWYRKFHKYHLC